MGNQRTAGLTKRGGIWHIDKMFRGARICESTGTGDFGQAQEYLAKRVIELRDIRLYGARELRSFRTAATKYLKVSVLYIGLPPFPGLPWRYRNSPATTWLRRKTA
jgi:hypothetical protein